MNQKELKELIEFLIEKDISEFELERGDVKVRIKRGFDAHPPAITTVVPAPIAVQAPVTAAAPAPAPAIPAGAPAAAPSASAEAPVAEEGLYIQKSPMVGIFYEAPAPGSPPFVQPGDTVRAGQVLCIVEAMKLMNEIEADVSGEIVKLLVNNGQPVQYGQPLFSIRART